jgi:lipopolysaccharide transport system ATP-binding protein
MSSESTMSPKGSAIINAIDLGKCYRIYKTPKERLKQAFWRGHRQYYREFWALRNVSFEVKPGESLGIIGRNGSGKSTLLQLICGTLTPTEGNLMTQGRIAALLELGSGFNPEFTGLENIYLNASLMGLSKEETDAKLEEILAFADIGDFVAQPVKTYSSGMTVRLAFAVIAHVNADILVVDEALAVGDGIFVQRCMRFIRRIREERCLLFVSHDAEAVKSLCSHALWLSKGSTQAFGTCKGVTLDYLRYCQATSYGEEITVLALENTDAKKREGETQVSQAIEAGPNFKTRPLDYEVVATSTDNLDNGKGWKTGDAELLKVSIKPIIPEENNAILRGGEEVEIKIRARTFKTLTEPVLGFYLRDRLGQSLFGENTLITRGGGRPEKAESGTELTAVFRLWFPMLPSGTYTLLASIADGDLTNNVQHHWVEDAIIVTVSASGVRYGLVGAFITHISLSKKYPT